MTHHQIPWNHMQISNIDHGLQPLRAHPQSSLTHAASSPSSLSASDIKILLALDWDDHPHEDDHCILPRWAR